MSIIKDNNHCKIVTMQDIDLGVNMENIERYISTIEIFFLMISLARYSHSHLDNNKVIDYFRFNRSLLQSECRGSTANGRLNRFYTHTINSLYFNRSSVLQKDIITNNFYDLVNAICDLTVNDFVRVYRMLKFEEVSDCFSTGRSSKVKYSPSNVGYINVFLYNLKEYDLSVPNIIDYSLKWDDAFNYGTFVSHRARPRSEDNKDYTKLFNLCPFISELDFYRLLNSEVSARDVHRILQYCSIILEKHVYSNKPLYTRNIDKISLGEDFIGTYLSNILMGMPGDWCLELTKDLLLDSFNEQLKNMNNTH